MNWLFSIARVTLDAWLSILVGTASYTKCPRGMEDGDRRDWHKMFTLDLTQSWGFWLSVCLFLPSTDEALVFSSQPDLLRSAGQEMPATPRGAGISRHIPVTILED